MIAPSEKTAAWKRSAALGTAALFLLCGSPAFGQATKTAGMLNTALTSEGVHPLVSMNRILLSDLAAPIEAALPPAKPYVFQ